MPLLMCYNLQAGLPEPPIFEIYGSGSNSRQSPATAIVIVIVILIVILRIP